MLNSKSSSQMQQFNPGEVIDNLETLRRIIEQKDQQIKKMETEFQERLNLFQQEVARDQDSLKQDIIQFMLKDNEQQKKIEQLHINYQGLQNQLEETFNESNNKIKTLLNINDKKDHEIEQLKQQIRDQDDRINHLRTNSLSKDKSKYETDAIVNHKILDLQRREADLTGKLREALDKNEQLQIFFESYQSEKEVKLIKQIEQLRKQNSSQIGNLSQNYEEQVRTSKEVIEQLQEHIIYLKERIQSIQDENQKIKNENDIANAKINQLLTICEKLQETEAIHDQTRRELIKAEESKAVTEKNNKLEIQALQIQLEEASKYIELTTVLQQKLNKKDQKLSSLKVENQKLQELVQDLKQQSQSIEQHFELHHEEQRKANIMLSKREFELQTIIESQAQNFIEQEQQLKQRFDELWQDYQNLLYAYELMKQKNGEDSFRLKLYKTVEKSKSRVGLRSQGRLNELTVAEKDFQSNKETIKVDDEAFMKTLENYQSPDQSKQIGKRLDRNVYVRRG